MSTNVKVIKKDGEPQAWDFSKVERAISLAGQRVHKYVHTIELEEMEKALLRIIPDTITVTELHIHVCGVLDGFGHKEIAESYRQFRNYKKDFDDCWNTVYQQTNSVLMNGDRENANFESTLVSTKGCIIRGYLSKEIFKRFYLSREEQEAIHKGYIYIHDMRDLLFNTFNCCLFDMGAVLKGGFKMASINYREPGSLLSSAQVISKVILNTTAQQFGGFTVPDIDKVMAPYLRKSIEKYSRDADKYKIADKEGYVSDKVERELRQAFTAIECDINTVSTSRGDFAFTTFSFGNLDDPEYFEEQRLICEMMLKVRKAGHGKGEPVPFPKLVFLFNREQYDNSAEYRKLFELSIETSSKCLYPDYLSLEAGEVAEYYKQSGEVVSPMGCRAYLYPEYNEAKVTDRNPDGMYFTGRANVGACSLNLPMIWSKSQRDGTDFWEELEFYMEMIRSFLKKRYSALANSKVSQNPMCFNQGGLFGGTKGLDEKIGMDIVKTFTASFGITSLNELNVLMEGKPLHESDQKNVKEVINFITALKDEYKKEDGFQYALYGTPAESLCGTQVKQYQEEFGIVPGVSDRKYFTNSFHMHVSAEMTPFEKQDMEHDLFHMIYGGHIQYCRHENPENLEAMGAVVLRAMQMGFYEGVNHNLIMCSDCGERIHEKSLNDTLDVHNCPKCNSTNLMGQGRACGYLSFIKLNGDTRFNDSKLAEIHDRKSM